MTGLSSTRQLVMQSITSQKHTRTKVNTWHSMVAFEAHLSLKGISRSRPVGSLVLSRLGQNRPHRHVVRIQSALYNVSDLVHCIIVKKVWRQTQKALRALLIRENKAHDWAKAGQVQGSMI